MFATRINLLTAVVSLCKFASMEVPIITRDTYDLIRFPNCSGYRTEDFSCHLVLKRGVRFGDKRTCTCKCKEGFVTYRDPFVKYVGRKFQYQNDKRGCVWYGEYHEGCTTFKSLPIEKFRSRHGTYEFRRPVIIDMTEPGNITLQAQRSFKHPGCLKVVPHVRLPAKNLWERIGIKFQVLKTSSHGEYSLQWESNSSDIYSYQGLVMRLDVSECKQPSRKSYCIMTKIAGTYNGVKDCKRRTTSGRCCVFPFVHQSVLYEDCTTTKDNEMPWCAVSLNTAINEGNHKWRENCVVKERPTEHISTQSISHQVTTTQRTPMKSVDTPGSNLTANANTSLKGSSGGSNTLVIAMIAGLLVLLIAAVMLAIILLRRKKTGKKSAKKRTSSISLADDGTYASLQEATPRDEQKSPDRNFFYEEPSIIGRVIHGVSPEHLNNMPFNIKKDANTHQYDTVAEHKSADQPGSIYAVPEVDYSSTTQLPKAKGRSDDQANHIYAVLECVNDAEADQNQADLSGRIYDEPAEMTSSKNVYDVPVVPDHAK